MAERLVDDVFTALDEQTVVVPSPTPHHTQALLCHARRRADVLFAMLRDGTCHDPRPARSG
jgi:hypothetical protein